MAHPIASDDKIDVGIPCYNRPGGLQDTLRCLQQQSHQNWTATIFDNASPDPAVRSIAEHACQADERIRYSQNETNVGPSENFRRSACNATAPYFMWASDDDLWHPDFMLTNLRLLQSSPQTDLACSSVECINRNGELIRRLPGFSRLSSSGNQLLDVETFLDDPEILGKANLFMGLFRTKAIQACIEQCWQTSNLVRGGADVVFLFAFVCRHRIVTHDEYHLLKRQDTLKKSRERRSHPRAYKVTKRGEFESYLDGHLRVAPTAELAELARTILTRRRRERFLYLIPPLRWLFAPKRLAAKRAA